MTVEVPTHWYDLLADSGVQLPPEKRPDGAGNGGVRLNVPKQLVRQNMAMRAWVEIPEPVRAAYARWRPTPLRRAEALEAELGTPARIYYKHEALNLAGTHKLSTALAQAHYYGEAGVRQLVTCTAAGQWGTAIALATRQLGLGLRVHMVRGSYERKPARRTLMELLGAEIVVSGEALADAMTAAIEDASASEHSRWILGGSEPFAILHSTVIGLEAIEQLRELDEWPDVVLAYMGGGKNLGGLAFPFLGGDGGRAPRCVAVESAAYPALTRGRYAYDRTDRSGTTPLARMYTLGQSFPTRPLRAQGMRYHAASKLISALHDQGRIQARAEQEPDVFDAAVLFARTEGVLPSPEAAHAVRGAIAEAIDAREEGRPRVVLFCLSDHGHFDLAAYQDYLDGEIEPVEVSDDEIQASLANLPDLEPSHASQ